MTSDNLAGLESSLMDLHLSVNRLIEVMQEHAGTLDRGDEVLDKLPLLDYYNGELLRNIHDMRERGDA
ncbi:MAG: hypothetical protein JF616_07540 [Fibrobacteres bacterium]|nr:hypothetical protein [Fibrobacterota bacterium]